MRSDMRPPPAGAFSRVVFRLTGLGLQVGGHLPTSRRLNRFHGQKKQPRWRLTHKGPSSHWDLGQADTGRSTKQRTGAVDVHSTIDAPPHRPGSNRGFDSAMSDAQLIAKIGETVWGASWQAPMATAVRQSRYTIEAWASGREPVPLEMWKELREATRLHYLKLADLDAEIVRAFDDAYQRAMSGKR
jgi:hypothetical protein